MSAPNVNAETGFPYGVFSANSCIDLAADIQSSGESLTYKEIERENKKAFEAIVDIIRENGDIDELEEELKRALACGPYYLDREDLKEVMNEIIEGHVIIPEEAGETDQEEAQEHGWKNVIEDIDGLEELLKEHGTPSEMDEETHLWDAGDAILQTGHLGGALLVWVIKSKWVTAAAKCSPCVPGAGDLDNPRDDGEESYCHCLPPSYYLEYEWDEKAVPRFFQELDDDNNLVGGPRKLSEFAT